MPDAPARLLVTLPRTPEAAAALSARLPDVPVAFSADPPDGPWPAVEAMLTGSLRRELPTWRADRTPRLRFVQRLYTGLDGFPFQEMPPGVAVAGNVGAFAVVVAEQAIALTLGLEKNLVANFELVRAGRLRPAPTGHRLAGRTVLLLGYGEIARAAGERLRAFGMTVHGLNRDGSARPGCDRMFPASELAAALAGADVVIDCRPLTRATRGSLGAAELAAMRPSAAYVNVGRAGTVDEAALYAHLVAHPEFRAGMEAWWQEDYENGTLGARFPFAALPNFLGTPHDSGLVTEARPEILARALDNLARFFRGEPPLHVADPAEYGVGDE